MFNHEGKEKLPKNFLTSQEKMGEPAKAWPNKSTEAPLNKPAEAALDELKSKATEDLKVIAGPLESFNRLAEKAKAPEQKKKLESLKDRAVKAAKKFLKFAYNATLVGFLAISVDYYATRFTVEKKLDKKGNVKFIHPDQETTHILNVLAGQETISFDEALKHFKKVVRFWAKTKNVELAPDFGKYSLDQMETYWKNIYGQSKNNQQPFSLKQQFYNFYYLERVELPPEEVQEIYNLIWKVEEECGNPKVRFQTTGPEFAGISFDNNASRPYFNPLTNTAYIPVAAFMNADEEGAKDLLAELSHGKQLSTNPLAFYLKAADAALRILHKGGLDAKRLSRAQDEEYGITGSFENEAHSTVEPELTEKYKPITKIRGVRGWESEQKDFGQK